MRTPFPHIYRKSLNAKDLRQTGFSPSDAQIGTDISSTATTYGAKFARDVRKLGENIGQLNTYVSWYSKNVMADGDNPPIGILLCTRKDHALVEYAVAGMDNQLFVSKYQLHLPEREQLQRELERTLKEGS